MNAVRISDQTEAYDEGYNLHLQNENYNSFTQEVARFIPIISQLMLNEFPSKLYELHEAGCPTDEIWGKINAFFEHTVIQDKIRSTLLPLQDIHNPFYSDFAAGCTQIYRSLGERLKTFLKQKSIEPFELITNNELDQNALLAELKSNYF